MSELPLLRVEGLVKAFHGNRAVDDVSFDVPAGHAVPLPAGLSLRQAAVAEPASPARAKMSGGEREQKEFRWRRARVRCARSRAAPRR